MAALYILSAFLLLGLAHGNKTDEKALTADKRITGGSWLFSSPSQARILCSINGQDHFCCNGVLISLRHVLTIASCLYYDDGDNWSDELKQVESVTVQLGKNAQQAGQQIRSSDLVVHEHFCDDCWTNDIALVRLPRQASYSASVRPALLPFPQMDDRFINKWILLATGWGVTDDYMTLASNPMSVWMRTMTLAECQNMTTHTPDTWMCATNVQPYSTVCVGDQGGPLTLWPLNMLMGLTLYNKPIDPNERCRCQCSNTINFFLDVRQYVPWIRSHMYS